MIIAGVDEAALGPKLGPFCAAAIEFTLPESVRNSSSVSRKEEPGLYKLLSQAVSSEAAEDSRIVIGDSKALYSPKTGISLLERTVAAVLEAAGLSFPTDFLSLINSLCPEEDVLSVKKAPWFAEAENFRIPWGNDSVETGRLFAETLGRLEIRMSLPRVRCVPAAAFNKAIQQGGGKSPALQSIMAPLLKDTFDHAQAENQELALTVDRQGGWRYYGEWLMELRPGVPWRAFEEGPQSSRYQTGSFHVAFLVGADALHMETALASMIAKYVRESAMQIFNSWWYQRIPGLKPTAGYPQDAKRFIRNLKDSGLLPEPAGFIRNL